MTDTAAPLSDLRLRLSLPAGWHRMPPPGDPAAADWVSAMVDATGFTASDAAQLSLSLRGALLQAAAQNAPKRLRYIYLGDPPRSAVQAWAFLDVVPRHDPAATAQAAADTYAAAFAGSAHNAETEVWHREVSRPAIEGCAAVLVHDLLTHSTSLHGEEPAERRLQHRVIVALFPEAQPILVRLTLSTPRLAAFEDIEAAAMELAHHLTLSTEPASEAAPSEAGSAMGESAS